MVDQKLQWNMSSNIEKGKPILFTTQNYAIEDSQVTYNDISKFFGLVPGACRPSK